MKPRSAAPGFLFLLVLALLFTGIAGLPLTHPHRHPTAVAATGKTLAQSFDAERASAEAIYGQELAQKVVAAADAAELARIAEEDRVARDARIAEIARQRASRAAQKPRLAPAPAAPVVIPSGDLISALGNCESHNNPQAVSKPYNSKGDRFWGAFQFMLSTWHNFKSGNPIDYSYAEQRQVIESHFPVSSWRTQFPHCARVLGVA